MISLQQLTITDTSTLWILMETGNGVNSSTTSRTQFQISQAAN